MHERPKIRSRRIDQSSALVYRQPLGARAIGMEVTESFAMTPTAAVAGLYFAHPDSRYFMVGKVGKDHPTVAALPPQAEHE